MLPRMNAIARTHKGSSKAIQRGASPLPPEGAGRISPALREAIDLRVRTGENIKDICKQVGISEQGWHAAMKRPIVAQHMQNVQMQYIQEVEAMKAGYKAQAFAVAAHLMHNAKSEAVRMRAVEFFAGGPAAPSVVVPINITAPGYVYRRPTDNSSGASDAQPIEIEGKATEV
jgi:hypothetical protein